MKLPYIDWNQNFKNTSTKILHETKNALKYWIMSALNEHDTYKAHNFKLMYNNISDIIKARKNKVLNESIESKTYTIEDISDVYALLTYEYGDKNVDISPIIMHLNEKKIIESIEPIIITVDFNSDNDGVQEVKVICTFKFDDNVNIQDTLPENVYTVEVIEQEYQEPKYDITIDSIDSLINLNDKFTIACIIEYPYKLPADSQKAQFIKDRIEELSNKFNNGTEIVSIINAYIKEPAGYNPYQANGVFKMCRLKDYPLYKLTDHKRAQQSVLNMSTRKMHEWERLDAFVNNRSGLEMIRDELRNSNLPNIKRININPIDNYTGKKLSIYYYNENGEESVIHVFENIPSKTYKTGEHPFNRMTFITTYGNFNKHDQYSNYNNTIAFIKNKIKIKDSVNISSINKIDKTISKAEVIQKLGKVMSLIPNYNRKPTIENYKIILELLQFLNKYKTNTELMTAENAKTFDRYKNIFIQKAREVGHVK